MSRVCGVIFYIPGNTVHSARELVEGMPEELQLYQIRWLTMQKQRRRRNADINSNYPSVAVKKFFRILDYVAHASHKKQLAGRQGCGVLDRVHKFSRSDERKNIDRNCEAL